MFYGRVVLFIPSHDADGPIRPAKRQWLADKAANQAANEAATVKGDPTIPFTIPEPKDEPFEALVLQEHFGLSTHLGDGGEPLVHLVYAEAAKENLNLGDPTQKLVKVFDVAHASHEFTPEDQEKNGAIFAGGRYHESRDPRAVLREIEDNKVTMRRIKAAQEAQAYAKAEEALALARALAEKSELDKAHAHADLVAGKVVEQLKAAQPGTPATPPAKPEPDGGSTVQ